MILTDADELRLALAQVAKERDEAVAERDAALRERDVLVAAAAVALRDVAERQRAACADRLHDLLAAKKATAVWVGADEIHATPLVTEK